MAFGIEDANGSRQVQADAFPLTVGGAGADVVSRDLAADALAYLGLSDGRIFLQPVPGQEQLRHNQIPVTGSVWLIPGDQVHLGGTLLLVDERDGRLSFSFKTAQKPKPVLQPPAQPLHQPNPPFPSPISREKKPRFTKLLLAGGFFALAAAAAFVFLARPVEVVIEPGPERMEISGVLPGLQFRGRYLLLPGTYSLTAEKAGFRSLDTQFKVGARESADLNFTLERLPGLLKVTGPEGSLLSLNENQMGQLPLDRLELPPGTYQVRVSLARHRDFLQTVEISGGGETQTLEALLQATFAPVTFRSAPAGARVLANGRNLGSTPLTAEITEGQHVFEYALKGYKPHRGRIAVTAGEPLILPSTRLTPADGNVVVTSQPAGALVMLDDRFVGTTPANLSLKPGQKRRLLLRKLGYGPQQREIRVDSGESREMALVLKPKTAQLRLSVFPVQASISLNGQPVTLKDGLLRVPAIAQVLKVSAPGFMPFEQKLTPLPGQIHGYRITLKSKEQVKKESLTKLAASAEGHQMKLIKPGKLQLGASRREPGRRANEVLRQVHLQRPFLLAAEEVSNAQFLRFKKDHQSGLIRQKSLAGKDLPVVRVTWQEAAAYCNWLSKKEGLPPFYVEKDGQLVAASPTNHGYRLPTEAEWVWAAKYGASDSPLKYPWGSRWPVTAGSGNFADASAAGLLPGVLTDYNDSFPVSAPVTSFSPNHWGVRNLGGNVAEWVHDYYEIGASALGESRDPMGPANGKFNVICGSSWMHSTITELRFSFRDYGEKPRPDLGFRVARYVE